MMEIVDCLEEITSTIAKSTAMKRRRLTPIEDASSWILKDKDKDGFSKMFINQEIGKYSSVDYKPYGPSDCARRCPQCTQADMRSLNAPGTINVFDFGTA